MPQWGKVCLLIVFLAQAGAGTMQAQNLVPNGDFNLDADDWTAHDPASEGLVGFITLTWEAGEDALAMPGSGALRITWDLTDPTGQVGATRLGFTGCTTAILPGATYRAGQASRLAGPTPFPPAIFFRAHDTPTCSTGFPDQPLAVGLGPAYFFQTADLTFLPTSQSFDVIIGTPPFVPDGMGGVESHGDVLVDKIFFRPVSEIQPFAAVPSIQSVSDLIVSFAGASSGGESPYPPNFFWTFGDGDSAAEQNPDHTYPATGTYLATLAVDSGFEQAGADLPVVLGGSVLEIPTLAPAGFVALALLLGVLGLFVLRRHVRP